MRQSDARLVEKISLTFFFRFLLPFPCWLIEFSLHLCCLCYCIFPIAPSRQFAYGVRSGFEDWELAGKTRPKVALVWEKYHNRNTCRYINIYLSISITGRWIGANTACCVCEGCSSVLIDCQQSTSLPRRVDPLEKELKMERRVEMDDGCESRLLRAALLIDRLWCTGFPFSFPSSDDSHEASVRALSPSLFSACFFFYCHGNC